MTAIGKQAVGGFEHERHERRIGGYLRVGVGVVALVVGFGLGRAVESAATGTTPAAMQRAADMVEFRYGASSLSSSMPDLSIAQQQRAADMVRLRYGASSLSSSVPDLSTAQQQRAADMVQFRYGASSLSE